MNPESLPFHKQAQHLKFKKCVTTVPLIVLIIVKAFDV